MMKSGHAVHHHYKKSDILIKKRKIIIKKRKIGSRNFPGSRFRFYFGVMNITEEKACLCALNRIFGFEPRYGIALIRHLGSAREVFNLRPDQMDGLLGPHSRYKGMMTPERIRREEDELAVLAGQGIYFLGHTEDFYPDLLNECEDPPIGIYVRSDTPAHELWKKGDRRIAVVGTRDISPYGKEWCSRIVSSLAVHGSGPMIVSGLALGTDICAHQTALEEGLPTIGVMATGPESVYPARHRAIAERMVRTPGCALVTDYPPGTAPLPLHFLRRNRIIAGLCEATVLIESRLRGGGMMTARLASSYNRDVYALPGRIDDVRSQGCNELLRSRIAEPVASLESFAASLGIRTYGNRRKASAEETVRQRYSGKLPQEKVELMGRIIVIVRSERGITIEEIADRTGCGYAQISELTSMLELDSLISIDLLQRCSISPQNI